MTPSCETTRLHRVQGQCKPMRTSTLRISWRRWPVASGCWRTVVGAGILALLHVGCRIPAVGPPDAALLPAKSTARVGQLMLVSDRDLDGSDPLLAELEQLRQTVVEHLQLAPSERPIRVYLFENQTRYRDFIASYYPRLPDRRAYFIGAGDQLAVYAFWGDRTVEDLRHELTHAVLHASLAHVPLWLDEGLAEYFETGAARLGLNESHVGWIAEGVEQDWKPDLNRLEGMQAVDEMNREDYAEAWAWVHLLLDGPPGARHVLLDYIASLAEDSDPGPIATQLEAAVPDSPAALKAHLRALHESVQPAGNGR